MQDVMQDTKPTRRIVTIDDKAGQSIAVQDGPAPDVRRDPARPGFTSTRIWLTDRAPPRIGSFADPTLGPHTLEPPKNGSGKPDRRSSEALSYTFHIRLLYFLQVKIAWGPGQSW